MSVILAEARARSCVLLDVLKPLPEVSFEPLGINVDCLLLAINRLTVLCVAELARQNADWK